MKIATARTKTSRRWRTQDITWDGLLDRLRTPLRTGETMREYRAMSREDRDRAKEAAGGFVGGALTCGQRRTDTVRERWLITLDADHAKPGAWDQLAPLLDYRMACYSTHSHTPESPRLRWIVPADRAMTPDEYPAVARKVASWLDIESMDPSTYEVARLMYWPTCASDGEYEFHEQDGAVLSVDQVLASYGDNEAWRDTTLWPIARTEDEVRVRSARQAGDPLSKPGVVGLFCRCYDVRQAIAEFLPEEYTEAGQPDRYTYTRGTTAGGAVVYNDGRFLFSNHATDPCAGHSVNAFDLVRIHKFGALDADAAPDTSATALPSYRAMIQWVAEQPEVKERQVQEAAESCNADFADLQAADAPASAEEDPDAWKRQLVLDAKTGEIRNISYNIGLLLRNLPDFKGRLSFDKMSYLVYVRGELPWRKRHRELSAVNSDGRTAESLVADVDWERERRTAKTEWTDNDTDQLYEYLERYNITTGKSRCNAMIDRQLKDVAMENSYHAIQSYLAGLTWDGVERLDTMLIRWLGAEDCPLNRAVTRLWMMGAVDRIMRPGCQFDSVLLFCGPQGIGKTRLLRALGLEKYYTNSVTDLSMDRNTAEKLRGAWIVDLGELASLRRAEVEAAKNFISTTQDQYRVPYAKSVQTFPRQCVFAGTTNEGAFLRDSTGERRYWVVPVSGTGDRGELRGFDREVPQLWAEAVYVWANRIREYRRDGQDLYAVNLYLYLKDEELAKAMKRRHESFSLPESDASDIAGYLDTLRPANWYDLPPYERRNFAHGDWPGDESACTLRIDRVCIKELKYELFDDQKDKDIRIGAILDSLPGWKKGGKKRNKAYAGWSVTHWVRIGSEEDEEDG